MSKSTVTENHLKTGGEHAEFKNKVGSGTMEVSSQCGEVFQELKLRRKHRYIIFKIGDNDIEGNEINDCYCYSIDDLILLTAGNYTYSLLLRFFYIVEAIGKRTEVSIIIYALSSI